MDRSTKKKAEIERKTSTIQKNYPYLWKLMISDWSSPQEGDWTWLMYSANYLFQTAGIRWAIDPIRLRQRLPLAPEVDGSALAALDYILLTHRHADHLDLELLHLLQNDPAIWIVPDYLLDRLCAAGLQHEKIMIPHSMETIRLNGMTIQPFEGFHWETSISHKDNHRGVPSTGYLIEFNGKRWLFPGDTRTYAPEALTRFGPVDILFAHLWLGRGCAIQDTSILLEAFCLSCLSSQPRRIIVTHLEEFGRQPEDFWDGGHYLLVEDWFRDHAPEIQVEAAYMGERCRI